MGDAKYVCNRCLHDEALHNFVLDEGGCDPCSYCDAIPTETASNHRSLPLEHLASYIQDKLSVEFGDVGSEMISYDNEEGHYYCETYTTYELLTDEVGLEVDERLINDIVAVLPDLTWCKKRFRPADVSNALRSLWQVFVDEVKHHTRYIFDDCTPAGSDDDPSSPLEAFGVACDPDTEVSPARILQALAVIVERSQLVTAIEAGTFLYRARVHDAGEHPSSAAELGPPPQEKASQSNRMSPAGIVMFYGAFDRDTAVKETFQPDREGARSKVVSVAQFRCQKPLAVLNLMKLPTPPSFFVDRELRHGIWFLREFNDDFIKPVDRSGMEHVEYVPTQIVTEFFRHHFHPASGEVLDGIIYRSSKNGEPACVLFFDACACGAETAFSLKTPVLQLQESATERIAGRQTDRGDHEVIQ